MIDASRWQKRSFAVQMGNIASEIARAIRFEERRDEKHLRSSLLRALELIDLTLDVQKTQRNVKELCRFREVVADWFWKSNVYQVKRSALKDYALSFVSRKFA